MQATITFDASDYGGVDFDPRRAKVYATNNAIDQTIYAAGNKQYIGSGNGTINPDGTGSIVVPIPGAGDNPSTWQTTIHFDVPDRNAAKGRRTVSAGPFTITASGTLNALLEEMPVQPEYASAVLDLVQGYDDHGNVSGALALDARVGHHELDATDATMLSFTNEKNGRIVSVCVGTGAADVSIEGVVEDVTFVDDVVATFMHRRDEWRLMGSGAPAGPADTTPPSDITDLGATGGEGTLTITGTNPTDAESTARIKYRVWLTSGGATGAYLTANSFPITVSDLPAGAYTVQAYSFSSGGQQTTPDSATATVTAPPGWNQWDSIDFTAQTDGSYASPKDFTTTGGRLLRATSSANVVVADKLITANDSDPITATYPGITTPESLRVTVPYNLAKPGGGYGQLNVVSNLSTGGVGVELGDNWMTGTSRRLSIGQDYGTGVVYTAEPGYTKESNGWINGIPAAGTLVVEFNVDTQLVLASIDGTPIARADYSAHENSLVGGFSFLRLVSLASVTGFTVEEYS